MEPFKFCTVVRRLLGRHGNKMYPSAGKWRKIDSSDCVGWKRMQPGHVGGVGVIMHLSSTIQLCPLPWTRNQRGPRLHCCFFCSFAGADTHTLAHYPAAIPRCTKPVTVSCDNEVKAFACCMSSGWFEINVIVF